MATNANGLPAKAQPSPKGDAATPKLNNDVEMGDLPSGKEDEPDIMQLARVGDVAAMKKLLETTDLDATFSDEEGITPLHVC
jgi:palmitoyltransferase ZDHHC13/17